MNIYDIAREAGVSISTVSKYLNNKNIRPELKERVEAVVKKYNFKPNALGRGLAIKSMKTIAVMVVDIRDPYYAQAAFEIDRSLSPQGYRVIMCNTLGSVENSVTYLDSLLDISVDGIVFIGSIFNVLNDHADVLTKLQNIPVVCFNGKLNVPRCSEIYVDDKLGIYEITKYVASKTNKDICYIQYLKTHSATLKKDGYLEAMEELNREPIIYYTDNLYDGLTPTKKILEDDINLGGIISGEDLISLSASNYLISKGYKVGKDIFITGYNASVLTDFSPVHLTSVDNRQVEVSNECAKALIKMMKDKTYKVKMSFKPGISYKESA